MKTLKITALVLATAISSFYATAQDEVMHVSLKNGKTAQYPVGEINDITFGEALPDETPSINGHEYVDLGLPSGLKWATCNIGSSTPQEFGNCYAWGESYTKSTYDINKSDFNDVNYAELLEEGVIDASGNLTTKYDTATRLWGENWRMPTKDEYQELKDCCTWTWVDDEYYPGAIVTGPNGNSIFIPAAGNYHGFQGEHGRYWTATAYTEDDRSWAFYFDEEKQYNTKDMRGTGIPVRPVVATENDIDAPENVVADVVSGGISVTWNAVSGATSYGIYRSADNATFKKIGVSGSTTFIDNNPLSGENYYKVQAYGAEGAKSSLSATSNSIEYDVNDLHAWVNLGLSSGTLWATCNIGADYPTEYGDYYAWGETQGRDYYNQLHYPLYDVSFDSLKEQGIIDADGNLTPQYDAATAKWGEQWRMPTKAEMKKLIDECTWEWTTINGRFCQKVTGPNGNYLVFPATGYRYSTTIYKIIYEGYYWSSTVSLDGNSYAFCLRFSDYDYYNFDTMRYYGMNIRPVAAFTIE